MNIEQILINKWKLLPPEKQQEVVDFVIFLETKYSRKNETVQKNKLTLENSQSNTNFLKGKLLYYQEPYEPVSLEDWEAMT